MASWPASLTHGPIPSPSLSMRCLVHYEHLHSKSDSVTLPWALVLTQTLPDQELITPASVSAPVKWDWIVFCFSLIFQFFFLCLTFLFLFSLSSKLFIFSYFQISFLKHNLFILVDLRFTKNLQKQCIKFPTSLMFASDGFKNVIEVESLNINHFKVNNPVAFSPLQFCAASTSKVLPSSQSDTP